jgi:hypothetical protein
MVAADRTNWKPADWWTFVAMAEGSPDDRTELVTGASRRAQLAWAAHHHVEEVVSSGGPAAALVILALVNGSPSRNAFEAAATGPLADLIRRQGPDLIVDLEKLAHRTSTVRRRAGRRCTGGG